MPRFSYSAIDGASGRELRGSVESASLASAAAELKERRLFPTALAESLEAGPDAGAHRWFPGWTNGMSRKTRVLFTRQLASLVRAGMPLLRGIEVLARQERQAGARTVIERIGETIRGGGSFSEALEQHPRAFDRLYVNMVRAGETAGALDVVLDRLAQFLEKAESTRGKVKTAMTYPLVIMIVSLAVVGGLMVFVIPKFETIFRSVLQGQVLPPLTQGVLAASTFVKEHVIATLAGLAAAYAGMMFVRRTAAGVRVFDWLALRVPVLGDLALKASVARFSRTLGTLLGAGVPILEALAITRNTSGNSQVAVALARAQERVRAGESLARPLAAAALFPPMVTSLIEVGEETGALPEMLGRIADTYDEEVDRSVAALTSLIEPVMIVIMAVLVGTIVLALFLPIVRIIQSLS